MFKIFPLWVLLYMRKFIDSLAAATKHQNEQESFAAYW